MNHVTDAHIPWSDVRPTKHFRQRLRERSGLVAAQVKTESLLLRNLLRRDQIARVTGSDPTHSYHPALALCILTSYGVVVLAPNDQGARFWAAVTLLPIKEAP